MPISTESSNGGGITADPGAADTLCGQNDEIEPNNDKQFTAAQQEAAQTKLDQLEENFGFDPEGVFYSLFRPLREKIKQIELEERNMEEYQNRQQQVIIDSLTKKLKVSIDQFSLMRSDQKKTVLDRLNANEREEKLKNFLGQFVGGQNKKFEERKEETDRRTIQKQKKELEKEMNQLKWELVAKIELYQKQQLLNIGLTLQNRWDSAACHDHLALIGPDRLIVQNNGTNYGFHSVFAKLPMPKGNSGIFYYEVKVLALEGFVFIGLATKQMPLDKSVGDYNGTYSYGSTGRFWAHSVEHYRFDGYDGDSDIWGKPKFGVRRDIVGCGVSLATRQIIYTLNGERLERGHLYVDSDADELFPCVSLLGSGTKIVANFGPHFEYN
uniref:B30.2/SPRY domain-containing protein n=1 Tax=Globodera pallida TaxID=36090 RepID=A0A183CC81_GLOPA